jgi:Tol biopolymer transport system component
VATFPGRNGEIVVLIGADDGRVGIGRSQVVAVNPRTGRTRTVAGCSFNNEDPAACRLGRPRLAPDGRRIAAPLSAPGCTGCLPGGVATFGIGGGPLIEHRTVVNVYGAVAWAPDGKRLAASRHVNEPATTVDYPSDLFIVSPEGIEQRRVTTRGDVYDPDWSSTGRLAYRTDRGIAVTTRSGTRIITGPGALFPSWSPHASRIAYQRPSGLYTVSANGGPRRRIALGPTGYGPAVWSPDGKSLAFMRGDLVMTVRSDGREARRVRGFVQDAFTLRTIADWRAR